jgi:16S rRNA (cytidine1402-2'-O)-methyltransferase
MESLKPGLYLLGLPLSGHDLRPAAIALLANARLVLAESARTASTLFKKHSLAMPEMILLNEHSSRADQTEIMQLLPGNIVVLISDSGMPVLADPGAELVRACHKQNYAVHVLGGPAAVTSALALAGLGNSAYTFAGFLPRQSRERQRCLQKYATLAHPVVFYETPYRLKALLEDIYGALFSSGLSLFLACELEADCRYVDLPVADIKKRAVELPSGRPVIIIYRPGPPGKV